MKLTQDMNNLVENKLILTKKAKKIKNNETNELISTYRDNNNSLENTITDNDLNKTSNNIKNNNIVLITQIDNINHDIKANHIFTQTDQKYNLEKDKNRKEYENIFSLNKINKENLVENNITKRINTISNSNLNMNILEYEKMNNGLFYRNRNNKIKNIKHPYVAPLTMIKLRRYKIIDDKDKFQENKKRYENNVIKKYKERGLNEFGFPISYDISLSRKYNYSKK